MLKVLVIGLVLLQEGCPLWLGGKVMDRGEPETEPAHNHCGGTVVPCRHNPNAACCPVCGGPCR
jgi:hypothetical protein